MFVVLLQYRDSKCSKHTMKRRRLWDHHLCHLQALISTHGALSQDTKIVWISDVQNTIFKIVFYFVFSKYFFQVFCYFQNTFFENTFCKGETKGKLINDRDPQLSMSLSCRSAVQKHFILKILFYFVFSKYFLGVFCTSLVWIRPVVFKLPREWAIFSDGPSIKTLKN